MKKYKFRKFGNRKTEYIFQSCAFKESNIVHTDFGLDRYKNAPGNLVSFALSIS